jgi:hypothetical protein
LFSEFQAAEDNFSKGSSRQRRLRDYAAGALGVPAQSHFVYVSLGLSLGHASQVAQDGFVGGHRDAGRHEFKSV